jgi:hypothetical protein
VNQNRQKKQQDKDKTFFFVIKIKNDKAEISCYIFGDTEGLMNFFPVILSEAKNLFPVLRPNRFQRSVFSDRKAPRLKIGSNRSNRLKSGFTENTVFDSELV